jgi:hypothetical protein
MLDIPGAIPGWLPWDPERPDQCQRSWRACGRGFFCGGDVDWPQECGSWTQAGGGKSLQFERSRSWTGPGWDKAGAWSNREETLLPVHVGPGGMFSCEAFAPYFDFPNCHQNPLHLRVPPMYRMP